jgi:xanthine dehydrogenase YagR molybdenum-binding subunit
VINFDYVKPSSVKAAVDALNKDATSQFIAGGTNLVDLMKRGVATPQKLIDITHLPLKNIEQHNNAIRIGALVLNSTVAEHPLIVEKLPLLSQALQAGASPQLRNMATVGGNLLQRTRCPYFYDTTMPCNKRKPGSGCSALKGYNRMHAIFGASENCIAVHPSDMCIALMALDPTVVVTGSKGERRIPFKDFHRLPGTTPEKDNNLQRGELITAVEIPVNDALSKNSLYIKIRDRASYAFALVSVAAALDIKGNTIQNARLAMGGVAHKPWRLTAAENFLKGKQASVENFTQAASMAMQDAKGYGYNNFKLKLAPNTLVQTLKTICRISETALMDNFFDKKFFDDDDRVTGRAVVTGKAKYAAEHEIKDLTYGVLVDSTISKGTIAAIDTKAAEKAPGVLAVITHLNSPKVPGYDAGGNPAKGPTGGKGLQVFNGNTIYFNGQPVALVIADTFERATYAASLIKVQYNKEEHQTDFTQAGKKVAALEGGRYKDNIRGEADAWKKAPVKLEAEYIVPLEVHSPMELHATTVIWDGDDKVTVYEKTQGVKSTQQSVMNAFKLKEENVQVYAPFVGGGFGSALRTWPHAIAALIGAKKTGRPLKLVLTRPQMFIMVGYRPYTIQKIGIGADANGKLVGLTHEADSITSMYEEFNEGSVNVSRLLYACPNVTTRYKVFPFNVSTPTWMRGPGEATGTFALESALDELAYAVGMDPIELRLLNYAETDPESNKPYSSKFLKEAYQLGADKIGWKNRNPKPSSMKEGEWLVGYGMGTGVFGASRGTAKALARMYADGTLLVQSAVSDSGPGTATSMMLIASQLMGIPTNKVSFELGDSSLPPGPTQGGSTTTSTLGSAVHDVCKSLQRKMAELAVKSSAWKNCKAEELIFENGMILSPDRSLKVSYSDVLKQNGLSQLDVTEESRRNTEMSKYAAYSYSVHFVKLLVHPATGVIKIDRVVTACDAGKIISPKTAESQVIGGVVGGIGMALMEEGVIDNRYGRWVNNNLADYHVPVQADVPHVEALFVNKPDPILNPIGAKGMGEIALIGFAAAVANAVYHATGRRIRELPITLDKLI